MLELDLALMLLLFLITNVLIQMIFQKGYPTGRALVPFWGFIVLSMAELYKEILYKLSVWRLEVMAKTVHVILCICICAVYISQINLHSTYEYSKYYKDKELEIGKHITGIDYYEGEPEPQQIFYEMYFDVIASEYKEYIEDKEIITDIN